MNEHKASLLEHLEELRRVIIFSFLSVFLGMIISYTFFREYLMRFLFSPLDKLGEELVIIGVTEGFYVQLKLALLGGIVLAGPLVLWRVLRFVLPALYDHEKKGFWLCLVVSILLFSAGLVFAYCCVLGLGLKILLVNFAEGLKPMISVGRYVSFLTSFLLPFGIVFEIPLFAYVLSRIGIISPRLLREKRGYVVLAVFIVAALFSPGGDVLTQLLLALPMLVLYELSIVITVLSVKRTPAAQNSKPKQ